jgi:hypothetical protein
VELIALADSLKCFETRLHPIRVTLQRRGAVGTEGVVYAKEIRETTQEALENHSTVGPSSLSRAASISPVVKAVNVWEGTSTSPNDVFASGGREPQVTSRPRRTLAPFHRTICAHRFAVAHIGERFFPDLWICQKCGQRVRRKKPTSVMIS